MAQSQQVCIVIPAFNEENTIEQVIRKIRDTCPKAKIIVVDDGSTDRTARKAKSAGAYVIRLPRNMGQWFALKVGFKTALKISCNIIVTMDADGEHEPADIPLLIDPIKKGEADLVIGSRFYNDKRTIYMKSYRYVGIKFFTFLYNFLTRQNISDVTSGFRAYNAEFLKILIKRIKERQYGVLEATYFSWKLGARISEKPIHFISSKRSTKGSIRFFINLCRVLLRIIIDMSGI